MSQDLQFSARQVENVSAENSHSVRVDVEEADTDEILDQIGVDEVVEHFNFNDIIAAMTKEEVLELIGEEAVIKHFDIQVKGLSE